MYIRQELPRRAAILVFWLCSLVLPLHAQFGGISPSGVNPAFLKMFGPHTNFSAKLDITVFDKNGKEWVKMPATVSAMDQNLRMEVDMAQVVSRDIPEFTRSALKQSGMNRIVSIVRADKNATFLMYPGAESYLNLPLSAADAKAAKGLTAVTRPGKTELIEGKQRTRNEVAVKDASGGVALQGTTWTASELQDFPVQIETRQDGMTVLLRFSQVALTKPSAAQFNVPATYTEYKDMQKMMFGIMKKMVSGSSAGSAD